MHDEEKSKSQKKREFRELKSLGIQLAGLSKNQLGSFPLSGEAREAILITHGMTRTALQRQYRRLQSVLAEEDVDAIRAALAGALKPHEDAVERFHEVEEWRDKLLSSDDSQVAAFAGHYPDCDRTHLRTLVRNARKEAELGRPPASARQLFRYVKQILGSEPAD